MGLFKTGMSTYGLGSLAAKPWNGKLKKCKRAPEQKPTERVYAVFDAKKVDALLANGLSIAAVCRELGYDYAKVCRAYRLSRS